MEYSIVVVFASYNTKKICKYPKHCVTGISVTQKIKPEEIYYTFIDDEYRLNIKSQTYASDYVLEHFTT